MTAPKKCSSTEGWVSDEVVSSSVLRLSSKQCKLEMMETLCERMKETVTKVIVVVAFVV